MMMFILKKLVSRFFFPLSLVIELLLLGIFLKKRRTKVILAGVAILYLFSFSPFGYLILHPLESQYVPISSSNLNKEVQWIVVLGGGSREDKALTPEDRLGDASLRRLLEGVRLSRLLPQSRLVLSGGDYQGISPEALIMQQVALDQGVARDRIIVEIGFLGHRRSGQFIARSFGSSPLLSGYFRQPYAEGNEDVYTLRHATDCGPYRFSGCMGVFSGYRLFPAGRDLGQYGKGIL